MIKLEDCSIFFFVGIANKQQQYGLRLIQVVSLCQILDSFIVRWAVFGVNTKCC